MPETRTTTDSYALIGAGAAGLAGARNLDRQGVAFVGFEAHTDVGGLWDIDNPHSTVYDSAHLISSRQATGYAEFPMSAELPDYPGHEAVRSYFHDFANVSTFGATTASARGSWVSGPRGRGGSSRAAARMARR